jgi:integrase
MAGGEIRAAAGLFRTLLTFFASTGLRSGAALALRWGDCELDGCHPKIYVRRSLSWARVQGEDIRSRFYPPKTKAGLCMVNIPTELAAVVERWKIASNDIRTRSRISQSGWQTIATLNRAAARPMPNCAL